MEFTKQDWALFREKIVGWQESYMEKLNKEYIKILEGIGNPSEKFWQLEKRIKKDKKRCGVSIEMRKQDLAVNLVSLVNDGVISFNDIKMFSNGLQETVRFLAEI